VNWGEFERFKADPRPKSLATALAAGNCDLSFFSNGSQGAFRNMTPLGTLFAQHDKQPRRSLLALHTISRIERVL